MVNDILGIQKGLVKNVIFLNEPLKVKRPKKCLVSGIPSESVQLKGNSLTSFPIQSAYNNGITNSFPTKKWVRCDASHCFGPSRVHLHRWTRLDSATPRETLKSDTPEKVDREDTSQSASAAGVPGDPQEANVDDCSEHSANISLNKNGSAKVFECCQFVLKPHAPDIPSSKNLSVVRYTPSLYQNFCSTSDPLWSSWETDYLFDLCALLDLRFIIIHDRYKPLELVHEAIDTIQSRESSSIGDEEVDSGLQKKMRANSQTFLPSVQYLYTLKLDQLYSLAEAVSPASPRPLEQLKERYYSVARRVVEHDFNKLIQSIERRFASLTGTTTYKNVDLLSQQKTQLLADTKAEMARHPLIRSPYDIVADKQRRKFLDTQYKMTENNRRDQQHLIEEILTRERSLKRPVRKHEFATLGNKKPKKNGHLWGSSVPRGLDPATSFQPISNEALWCTKPGVILASQVMQQFAAPILLQTATGSSRSSLGTANSSLDHSSGYLPLSPVEDTAPTGDHPDQPSTAPVFAMKKHKERIEDELKALGFGTASLPLWPTYRNREIVEAFNTLRVDIVTLINLNTHVEQLEKQKGIWKAKLSQIKEERNKKFTTDQKSSTTVASKDANFTNQDMSSRKSQDKVSYESERPTLFKKSRKSVSKKN